jgi:TusA-related sulfurtransferase
VSDRPFHLDVRGLSCPEPVLRVKKALDSGLDRQLSVLTDSHIALENISRLARYAGFTVKSEDQDGQYCLLLCKLDT